MRKIIIPVILAGTLGLSGCAAGLGQSPLEGILGGILGGNQGAYNNNGAQNDFERAAVRACSDTASQYGRIQIVDVRQDSRDIVRVRGRIETRDQNRDEFSCSFNSNGRITDFRRG